MQANSAMNDGKKTAMDHMHNLLCLIKNRGKELVLYSKSQRMLNMQTGGAKLTKRLG